MQDKPKQGPGETQVRIKAKDEVLAGTYANTMIVTHTKEEFVLDFLSVFPPQGTLNARVILSPGHYKRIIRALAENLGRYEARFGAIEESVSPEGEAKPKLEA